ncbi:MAG TPA: hypothetical protein VFG42_08355 [Baekduia sp.]|uniref:DoxX family protein n=1 Tax=Baekduia sp. TaxID=2600305 RepID=UPI002D77BCA3|nr:hypothetical protein [Baekduia sp.]HET6506787.1 hypothetical protein [Baekduia sp.]
MPRLPRRAAGPTFVAAGLLHFVAPKTYESIMPDYLPAHRELVYASGVAEAAGGAGLLSSNPTVRKWAAYWLVATLVAVFPANLHMALNPDRYRQIPKPALWGRLPLQLLFIRWVLAAAKRAD